MKESRIRRLEWAVLGLAVAVRGAACFALSQTRYGDHPLVDAYTYWDQARKMVAGKWPFPDGFYQPPGYPALLALVQGLAQTDALFVPRLLQLSLGVLTTLMLIRLGRHLGRGQGAPWMGAVAGLVYTLYPTTVLFELDLLTPAVTNAAAVGAVSLLLLGELRPGRCLGAGALIGLAAVAHPSFLLIGLAALVWLWFVDRKRLAPTLAFGCGLALALTPVTLINITQFKHLSFTSNNAGINFYMGNNPGWRETSFLRPGLRFRKLALEAEPHKRDGFARDDYWMERAWSEIQAYPMAWAATVGTKAYWSIHDTEIPRNEDYRCRTARGPMAWLAWSPVRYGLVFPFALVGAGALWRRRQGLHGRLVVGAWLAMQVPLVVFLVADRYRLATWPFVALCVPFGLQAVRDTFSAWRQGQRPHWAWSVFLAAAIVPWLPIDARTAVREGWCHHVDANLAYMDKDLDVADGHYRAALALDPGDLDAHNWLARTLARRGERAAAIDHITAILRAFPDHFPTLKFMASLQRGVGDHGSAAEYLVRAYRVPGRRTNTGVQAVKALRAAGRRQEAAELMASDPTLARHPKLSPFYQK